MLITIILLGQHIVLIFVNNLLCMKNKHTLLIVCKMNGIGFVFMDNKTVYFFKSYVYITFLLCTISDKSQEGMQTSPFETAVRDTINSFSCNGLHICFCRKIMDYDTSRVIEYDAEHWIRIF